MLFFKRSRRTDTTLPGMALPDITSAAAGAGRAGKVGQHDRDDLTGLAELLDGIDVAAVERQVRDGNRHAARAAAALLRHAVVTTASFDRERGSLLVGTEQGCVRIATGDLDVAAHIEAMVSMETVTAYATTTPDGKVALWARSSSWNYSLTGTVGTEPELFET